MGLPRIAGHHQHDVNQLRFWCGIAAETSWIFYFSRLLVGENPLGQGKSGEGNQQTRVQILRFYSNLLVINHHILRPRLLLEDCPPKKKENTFLCADLVFYILSNNYGQHTFSAMGLTSSLPLPPRVSSGRMGFRGPPPPPPSPRGAPGVAGGGLGDHLPRGADGGAAAPRLAGSWLGLDARGTALVGAKGRSPDVWLGELWEDQRAKPGLLLVDISCFKTLIGGNPKMGVSKLGNRLERLSP